MATAMFAAGCFWGVQAAFARLPGVLSTTVGYAGGHTTNPSYEEVCTDSTGHAEVVRIEYDPQQISYEELINVFWDLHDPTQLNRQGVDIGTQYRSAIFYQDDEQAAAAHAAKQRLQASGRYKNEVVTEILPAPDFYLAEDYHQHYFDKQGGGTCHIPAKNKDDPSR